MNLFRRRTAPSPRARSIPIITVPAERLSLNLSLSSSSEEDTPSQNGEPSQPGSSSLPPLEDGLFPHILNPPKPCIEREEHTCGICGDTIFLAKPQHFPSSYASYASPTSSDSNPDSTLAITGISVPCGRDHRYCFPCLSTYLKTKLADASFKSVFPITCPECNCWIQEWTAREVLSKEEMEGMWYWAKVFDEVPTFYCPIGTCGARVELPAQECSRDLRRAVCPACKESFCYRCQVKWHEGQTCAKYARASGAINMDKAMQKLAKEQKWRRCPKCRIVVERNQGCRHISCRCGYQFCYNCGRHWGDGCGTIRSKICFPLTREMWPETRSRVVEMIRDLFRSSDSGGR